MVPEELYLELLKKCLTRVAFPEAYRPWVPSPRRPIRRALVRQLRQLPELTGLDLVRSHAPVERLAVLRLDGDMYESTMEALRPLYPKLSKGGYLIIDDYALPGCRAAVDDYRREQRIAEPVIEIDRTGVYWRKES